MTGGASLYSIPVRSPDPEPGVSQILIVCHANQCRSPYGEAIARRLAGNAPLRFASGGLIGGGRPMPETGRLLAPTYGLNFDSHRSREVDVHDFSGFDLVLTMARAQARELVAADPGAWPRIFTVKQFARWVSQRPWSRDSPLGSWLDREAASRSKGSILGASVDDDIADPVALPAAAWRQMVSELTDNLTEIVATLSPRQ